MERGRSVKFFCELKSWENEMTEKKSPNTLSLHKIVQNMDSVFYAGKGVL